MGEDGVEIETSVEKDLRDMWKFEERGFKEGWWMEKVEDLKAKMEYVLKFDLARYLPQSRSPWSRALISILMLSTYADINTNSVIMSPFPS